MNNRSPQDILLVEPSSLTGSIIVATARQLNLPTVRQVNSVRMAQQRLSHESYAGVIVSLDEQEQVLSPCWSRCATTPWPSAPMCRWR